MSEWLAIFCMTVTYILGVILGYALWAPETPFKQGFREGLTLKILWGKWVKNK